MAFEWLDTAGKWIDRGSTLLNAAQPFLNVGASIYDRNQTQNAIGNAFNDYRGFADRSLNTLAEVYNQGAQATAPYRDTGTRSLVGYENLLRDPTQITNNPGYRFRFNQGQEALQRSAASKRLLNSGNFATAAQEYGQGFATQEYDNALSRYLPMIQAGQNATGQFVQAGQNYGNATAGVNIGLGEAAAGSRIGQSGANSRMVTDFLGLTGGQNNPFGKAADTVSDVRSGMNTLSELGNLSNAGGGNPLSAIGESWRNIGDNTWADPFAGPRTTPKMPAKTGALTAGNAASLASAGIGGTGLAFGSTAGGAGALGAGGFAYGIGSSVGAGTASTLPGMGATTGAFNSATAHIGAQGLSAGSGAAAGASGAGTTGATSALGGAASALGVAGLLYGAIQLAKMSKGGSVESAKTPKLYAQLQRDQAADPSGATTKATVDRLLRGNLWPGEGNQWVVKDLLSNGVITWQYPTLYASDSVVNINDLSPGNNKEATLQTFVELAGMPDEDAQKLQAANKGVVTALRTTINKSEEGYDSPISIVKKRKSETEYNQIIAKYMPQAVEEATKLRARIKAVDPSADLAKLDIFIAKNSR